MFCGIVNLFSFLPETKCYEVLFNTFYGEKIIILKPQKESP